MLFTMLQANYFETFSLLGIYSLVNPNAAGLFPLSDVNRILHAGSYPRYLSWLYEFQKDRLENVGAVGVEHLGFPLTRHIAIQQLVASAQTVTLRPQQLLRDMNLSCYAPVPDCSERRLV